MLGNVCGRNGCDSPPAVAQDESWGNGRKNDTCPQNCAGNGGNERRTRLAGLPVFSRCAAAVCLRLAESTHRFRAFRLRFVHRAGTVGAARHARFRRRRPAGANRHIAGRDQNGQRKHEQSPAENQHIPRMQDRAGSVNSTPIFGSSIGVLRLRLTDGVCGSLRANDRQQKGTILRRFNVVRDQPIQGKNASRR